MGEYSERNNLLRAKPNKYWGMTRNQIVILSVMGFLGFFIQAIFIGIIIYSSRPISLPTSTVFQEYLHVRADTTLDKYHPVIRGSTNLPDNTIILVTVKGTTTSFSGQDRVTVKNGIFSAGPFGDTYGLEADTYTVEALMPIPSVQPESVRKVIGDHGERLIGDQVVHGDIGITLEAYVNFNITKPSPGETVLIGIWYDTWAVDHETTITKTNGIYKITYKYPDGSSETITPEVKVVYGEERLYYDDYGDWMVIQPDRTLSVYDMEGLIYEIKAK